MPSSIDPQHEEIIARAGGSARSQRESREIDQIATALSKAQGEFAAVERGAVGQEGNRRFRYADLDAFLCVCRPVLARHGLAIIQRPLQTDGALIHLQTIITHASGQWISGELVVKPDHDGPKAMGSAITYARRYSLQSMLGLSAADDDGDAASKSATAIDTLRQITAGGDDARVDATVRAKAPAPDLAGEELGARIIGLMQRLGKDPAKLRALVQEKGAQRVAELPRDYAEQMLAHLESEEFQAQADSTF